MAQPTAAAEPAIERVSTLELFFDLVFVFTLTELNDALSEDPTLRGVVRTALLLGVIWWMYGGYAWLTNTVAADRASRQVLLLGGMGGFFVVALAVPDAFTHPGPALGLGYLAVVLVHTGLFLRASSETIVQAMRRVSPGNLLAAACVLAGLWIGDAWAYVGLSAALAVTWGAVLTRRTTAFEVGAAHFVERHGLIVIVAIGESVVSVGIGLRETELDLALAIAALLGLALSAGLWLTYFGRGRDEAAERALAAASPARTSELALRGFGIWHGVLLLAIVGIASGLKSSVAGPFDELDLAPALFLAGGLALYLAADLAFLRTLGVGDARPPARAAAVAAALAATVLGTTVAASAELLALATIPLALVGAERPRPARSTPPDGQDGPALTSAALPGA